MMKCDMTRDLLPLYIDECCSEGSKKFVEEHLKECEECRRFYVEMCEELEVAEKGFNADEADRKLDGKTDEQIFREGKNLIKSQVKKDYIRKISIVDLILNVILIIFFVVVIKNNINYLSNFMVAFGYLVAGFIGELLYLFQSKNENAAYVSKMLIGMSVGIKIMVAGIGVAVMGMSLINGGF